MKNILSIIINFFFRRFKIQKKILFQSQKNLTDGCPLAIYKYMKENNINDYKLVWIVEKGTDTSLINNDEYAFYRTFKALYHQATAKYWVRSQSYGSIIKKRKEQSYIQVWHGNGPFKRMGYDIKNDKDRPQLEHTKEWDFFVANSESDKSIIKSSTGYNGKFYILGAANLDYIMKNSHDKKYRKDILKKLNIKDDSKKIVLYAPTFRDFDLDKEIVNIPIKKLKNLSDYIIIVRLHPWVREKVDKTIFSDNIINGCDYPDVEDLLSVSDILITDYSSVCFQFAILNRPVLFYPYDYDKYVEIRGGFYIDYKKDLPGPICYNEEQLYDNLDNIEDTFKKYKDKMEKFNKKYNKYLDGQSCKRFIEALYNGDFDK